MAASEFVDNSHCSCTLFPPNLYVGTKGGGGLTSSGFYVGIPPD